MIISDFCVECLYNRQKKLTDNKDYLREVREILDNRAENATSPYMVYEFNKIYERYFGKTPSYRKIKRQFNDLVLSMEEEIRVKIENSKDPLAAAFLYARVGNYIDFGALKDVSKEGFLELLDSMGMGEGGETTLSEIDKTTMESFVSQCKNAKSFLLITDNCGEIVFDKLFLEQLKKQFPNLTINIMVRGGEVLNDATTEDARYTGLDKLGNIISNGTPIAGTVYHMISDEAKALLDSADIILSKGQGNYETLADQGRHIFYSFLCKCDLFINRFNVPKLTGMFVEEFTTPKIDHGNRL